MRDWMRDERSITLVEAIGGGGECWGRLRKPLGYYCCALVLKMLFLLLLFMIKLYEVIITLNK